MRRSLLGVDPRSFRALRRHREAEQSKRLWAVLEEERLIRARVEAQEERYARVEAELAKIEAAERAAREPFAAPVREGDRGRPQLTAAQELAISKQEAELATLHAIRSEIRALEAAAVADVEAVIARLSGASSTEESRR